VTRDVDRLAKQLGRLDDFGYTTIPRHIEEAVLLCQRLNSVRVDLHGRQIRPETVQRFGEFTEALNRARNNPNDRPALAHNFGDTFWFYFYTRVIRSQ
jgi:hypothetical protein